MGLTSNLLQMQNLFQPRSDDMATVSELIEQVRAAVPKLAHNQARALIKANNIRSEGKIAEAVEQYKGMTKEQLATELGEAEADPEPVASKRPARKAGSKTSTTAKKIAKRGGGERRQRALVEAGPRGFRFGEVWNNSVKEGSGVALHPANANKLYAHADSLGIAYNKREDDAASIAKKIARKL
jgi:hypothetical protein